VKDELKYFLAFDQGTDGGFGYTAPGSNVPRTGAGIACLAWAGFLPTDPEVIKAIDYLDTNWSWDNLGNLYAMYAINKGMRGWENDPSIGIIDSIGSHNWYVEYADFLIAQQVNDGSWTDCCWFNPSIDLSTAAGVLILRPVVVRGVFAVADAEPKEAPPCYTITFDHSGSYHLDPLRTIVSYRWDFNEDGIWDYETADKFAKPTWQYCDAIGCGEEVVHKVTLKVEDDRGQTDEDTESIVIKINLFNHPPVAIGDPTPSDPNYEVSKGSSVLLDGSLWTSPDLTDTKLS